MILYFVQFNVIPNLIKITRGFWPYLSVIKTNTGFKSFKSKPEPRSAWSDNKVIQYLHRKVSEIPNTVAMTAPRCRLID